MAVDTNGLLLVVLVTSAGIQDRDAARLVLTALRICLANVSIVWAGAAYVGQLVTRAATTVHLAVTIVRKFIGHTTFRPSPRRWVVERAISWINRSRRTVRDYERHPEHHAAMIQ